MADQYPDLNSVQADAYTRWAAITPNDGADLPMRPLAIVVGVAGNVSMVDIDGSTVTIALPAGIHRLRPVRVRATSTTATGLVALW